MEGVLDTEVVARLSVRHDDSEENVRNRLWFWDKHGADLRAVYCNVSLVVYAERAPEKVYDDVYGHVVSEDTWHDSLAVGLSTRLPDIQYLVVASRKLCAR